MPSEGRLSKLFLLKKSRLEKIFILNSSAQKSAASKRKMYFFLLFLTQDRTRKNDLEL